MKKLSISLLSLKDRDKQIEVINNVKEKNVEIHFDITDERFTKPKGIELELIRNAKESGKYADVHLMVEKPVEDKFIDKSVLYGADSITIHYEIDNFEQELSYLISEKMYLKNQGKKLLVGIAIKIETDISVIDKYINQIDKVLIMSVDVGYGGQPYDTRASKKIAYLKEKYKDLIIEIDGGINDDIIKDDIMNEVDEFVIGSAITKYENYNERIDYFLENL